MPLTPNTLVHQSGRSGGPNICTYTNAVETVAQQSAAGYFDGVADRLNVGDVIHLMDMNLGTFRTVRVVTVTPQVTVITPI